MKKASLFLLVFISLNTFSQKKKYIYKPILNTTLEQSFPNAAAILVMSFKISMRDFDYANKKLLSTRYEYYRGISRYRCRFLFSIDENNTLDVNVVNIQWWSSSNNNWENSSEGLFIKTEEKFRTIIADGIRQMNLKKEVTEENQNWFFKDLTVNSLFFKHATNLAGDRWFESYLKDKEVKWNLTFYNIYKNKSNNFKYKELYSFITQSEIISLDFDQSQYFIVQKYTNKDINVLTKKGQVLEVNGFCRFLRYDRDKKKFHILLTDNLEDAIPVSINNNNEKNTKKKSILDVADKLRKLKELVDDGIITEDEFKKEKEKILNEE